jgi:acyl carrier protein
MDYGSKLSDFIKQEILHGRSAALDEEQDLLNAGIIDSLGILRLVSFIEEQFGVQVPDEDVVFENFQSIRAMSNYIAQRKAAA